MPSLAVARFNQAVAFSRRNGLLRDAEGVGVRINVKPGKARLVDGFGKRAEFLQPLSGNLLMHEAPAKKTPEQLFDMVLAVTFGPSRRKRLAGGERLTGDQLTAANFFQNEGPEVVSDIVMSFFPHSARGIQQRASVVDAGLHCSDFLFVDRPSLIRAHGSNLAHCDTPLYCKREGS
jgi:hypothetical protein